MDERVIAGLTVTNNHEYALDSENDGSEPDIAPPLEVVFDTADSQHRRKSSITTLASRPGAFRRRTSCIVHGFLQDEKLILDSPSDNFNSQRSDKGSHEPPHEHGPTGMQSRLLTKKQLSDMAFSIRELSKRLGRFKLKLNVNNIFLLTKAHDEHLVKCTREVAEWLLSPAAGGFYTVYVEDKLREKPNFDAASLMAKCDNAKRNLKYWTHELCRKSPHTFDIVLALGGDGTVLYASWLFQRVVPPVLSFALGSLGFLTKFDYGSFRETLNQAFHHGLTVSLRLRLEATVMRVAERSDKNSRNLIEELIGEEQDDHHTHRPEIHYDILNDLVMDRGPNPTMSSIEVFGDDYHITTVQADGICVATPTGSTAYNLAAGGSLCHPDNPVVLLTAICAHTLSFRPIILPDTILLRLGVPYDSRSSPWVSFDGKERIELKPGDYVTISASRFPFPTVLPLGRGSEDWIDSLSRTLNWNSRQRQKAFKD